MILGEKSFVEKTGRWGPEAEAGASGSRSALFNRAERKVRTPQGKVPRVPLKARVPQAISCRNG